MPEVSRGAARVADMCRNIRPLHNYDPPTQPEEVREAALQYVRKISGMQTPSRANAEAFELAVAEVTDATQRLLDALVTSAPPNKRFMPIPPVRQNSFSTLKKQSATRVRITTCAREMRGAANSC